MAHNYPWWNSPAMRPNANDDTISGAVDLVNARFNQVSEWIGKHESDFHNAVRSLRSVFHSTGFPGGTTPVNYDFIDQGDLSLELPEMPSEPEHKFTRPSLPGKIGAFDLAPVGHIGTFELALEDPEAVGFDFEEAPYQSELFDDIRNAMKALLAGGGTGLGEEVESLLWKRALMREEAESERVYIEAEEHFASRGHILPPGALAGRLAEAAREQARNRTQISADIAIEQARLARDETQNIRQTIVQLEALSQDLHNKIQQRAFEKVRDAAMVIHRAHELKVSSFIARINAHRANAELEIAKAEVSAKRNQNIADVYKADIEAYRAQVQAELGIVEGATKVFAARIGGFSALADARAKELSSNIEIFRAKIQQSSNQTALSIQEAEMVLTKYIEGLRLDADLEKSHANILAQIVSSLYNAISVSGRLSANTNNNYSRSINENYHYS
jgi:hypothetical protein